MIFDDDILLITETRDEVSNKLDEWREDLEGKRLHNSRTKIEYLRCDFSGTSPVNEPEVSIDETVVKSTTKYKYLGSIVQRDEEIDGDVNHCIHSGCLNWRVATAVLCDREFPTKLKENFYRAAIRRALIYGTEYISRVISTNNLRCCNQDDPNQAPKFMLLCGHFPPYCDGKFSWHYEF
ncbi:uncharacterized protein LOC130799374 [Amaranthus tricolor]|uniref:uncharacterized protein LOC130799374 n=1 Tax=Amaranthus tricolor TaxID=29722 RepID=UPI0025852CBE|nr:uncharacterized protein LOC130799374 [Amaranthus tricolor]